MPRKSFRRIILIQAPLGRPEPLVYPLGISLLAAHLPENCDIRLIDPNRVGVPEEKRIIQAFQPEVIGISIRNIDSQMSRDLFYYYQYFREHLRQIKTWAPDAVLVLGGSGFSLFPEKIMEQNPEADFGVYLEAERSFPALLDQFSDPMKVPGIFFRKDGEVSYSGDADYPPLDDLPFPRYDLLDPKPYQKNGGVGVQTKRGCPLRCAYCTYPHLNGKVFRFRPVDHVIEEIKQLKKLEVNEITFVDGVFNLPMDRTRILLEKMKEENLNIQWHGWFSEHGFDRSFALLCKETGCTEFSFSPDGYSEATLKALGKTIHREDIHNVVQVAKEVGDIRVAFNFFWNPPDQTLRSFLNSIRFAIKCKLGLKNQAGGLIFGNPRIEPDTPLRQRAIQDRIITEETDLLPESVESLRKLFYSNPSTRYLDVLFSVYTGVWRLKKRFRNDRQQENRRWK